MGEKFKEIVDKYGVMQLLGSDGACACDDLHLFGIDIKTHCYKTTINSRISGCECGYSGVHIKADPDISIKEKELKEIAKIFADYISEAYATDVNIVIEKEN